MVVVGDVWPDLLKGKKML